MLVTEHRQQHLPMQLGLHRMPIDVEEDRKGELGPFSSTSRHHAFERGSAAM
jgi:hypothetical protein